MSRYTIQTEDGKVHYMDAEIEERVRALEEAVIGLQVHLGLDASQEMAASLQESLAFESRIEEEKLQLQEAAAAMHAGALEESAE